MDKGSIAVLLVVIGLGGVVVWLLTRSSNASFNGVPQTAPTPGLSSATGGYTAAALNILGNSKLYPTESVVFGGNQGVQQQKAGIARAIGSAFGIPSSVTDTASKLDVSGYVESYAVSTLGLGSSKVGRGSNGKDVFPNDMTMCAQRGRTSVESCSQLYNLATKKWAWQ